MGSGTVWTQTSAHMGCQCLQVQDWLVGPLHQPLHFSYEIGIYQVLNDSPNTDQITYKALKWTSVDIAGKLHLFSSKVLHL